MTKTSFSHYQIVIVTGLATSILIIHFCIERSDVWLLPAYVLSFACYLWVIRYANCKLKYIIWIAIALRLLLLFGVPHLSDDFYRFIWDGDVQHLNINPYAATPKQLLKELDTDIPLRDLYQKLNSPHYTTVYPPFSQWIFSLATAFGGSEWIKLNLLRLILLLLDVGGGILLIKLLHHHKAKLVMCYALNPLVVLELIGNVHFEGIVVFCMLLFIWLVLHQKHHLSMIAIALAIATKLTPIMFLPLIFLRWQLPQVIVALSIMCSVCLFVAIPYLDVTMFLGMWQSVSLFFNHFEFNASLFFLIRELGFYFKGYDVVPTIGPLLSIIATISIVVFSCAVKHHTANYPKWFLVILCIQLLLSTTVHPWYIIPLLAYGILASYFFPIVWSFFIFFTYTGYATDEYVHPFIFIHIEYLVVSVLIYIELIQEKPLFNSYLRI